MLHANLTHVIFGSAFNQPLTLPANLTHVIFGSAFNQQLILPTNLHHNIWSRILSTSSDAFKYNTLNYWREFYHPN